MADLSLISFGAFTVDTGTDELLITAHGVFDGNVVRVASSGTLPTGLSPGVDYYVVGSTADPDRFQVSLTPGGSAELISSAGSGTHTAYRVVSALAGDLTKVHAQSLAWFLAGAFTGDLTKAKSLTGPEFVLGKLVFGGGAASSDSQSPPWRIRSINADTLYHALGGRDNTEGSPGQPSLKILGRGYFPVPWVIRPGVRSVSCKVKQPVNVLPRPSIVIRANPLVGLNADVEVAAQPGTDWVIVQAGFTATAEGGVYVELRGNYDGQMVESWWDNLVGS